MTADGETCPVCGDEFEPDPTGRRDRTELNLGKPAGYCGLACFLADDDTHDNHA